MRIRALRTLTSAALPMLVVLPGWAATILPEHGCARIRHEGAGYIVCRFIADQDDIRTFHADDAGRPLYSFAALRRHLARRGLKLLFAMNGGMFTPTHAPAGLYIEAGETKKGINLRRGRGNFHLLPNGVFWLKRGRAGVTESHRFARAAIEPDYATQSGPMLVIDGRIHPRFRRDSVSRKIRNGVGVMADRRTVWFALSEEPVNFHAFARLFRDRLKTPNALFLDGTVSQMHAPAVGRYGSLMPVGPMIAVVAPATARKRR